jgi:hypothetical protein
MAKGLHNTYMATLFGHFYAKSLFGERKLVHNIYGNPNSPQADKLFFPNLYKACQYHFLIGPNIVVINFLMNKDRGVVTNLSILLMSMSHNSKLINATIMISFSA